MPHTHKDYIAWGKINQGQRYGILTFDVWRAWIRAGLNNAEWEIIEHLWEHTWAEATRRKRRGEPWPDAPGYALNVTHLARRLRPSRAESYRKVLDRARQRLVRTGMLRVEGPLVWIVKEADTWTAPHKLTEEALAYAAEAQDGPASPPIGSRARYQIVADDATNQSRGSLPDGSGPRDHQVAGAVYRNARAVLDSEDSECVRGRPDTHTDQTFEADEYEAAAREDIRRFEERIGGKTNGSNGTAR